MKAFQCDKCGEEFRRERTGSAMISFDAHGKLGDGNSWVRTLAVDLLYKCVHSSANDHQEVDFCDDCLLWLLEEYKGSIMVEVGREEDVTETGECLSQQA